MRMRIRSLRSVRCGFTVMEVALGLALGLALWAILMTLSRGEARMRQRIDSKLAKEHVPAVLYRHLSRDLSRASLAEGRPPIRISDDGRSLEIVVQSGPTRIVGNSVEIPIRTVAYRFLGTGRGVIREEAGRREPLGVTGLSGLAFSHQTVRSKDTLRIQGTTRTDALSGEETFALSFPVGARRPGPVRWVSLIKPRLSE